MGGPTWVADTRMRAPVIAALAVFRADVGVARVRQVAAVLHADLQALGHVDVGHVGGRLAHADTLKGVKTPSLPAMATPTFWFISGLLISLRCTSRQGESVRGLESMRLLKVLHRHGKCED